MSKKYAALGKHLKAHSLQSEVPLTFAEIEKIIGSKLPASAFEHRPWWSNNPSNNVMTRVWRDAGFEAAQVDMKGKRLVFRRIRSVGVAEEEREFMGPGEDKPVGRHPAIGALKGTFTIEPGYDLTKPAMDDEEIAEMEANVERLADMVEQGSHGNKG